MAKNPTTTPAAKAAVSPSNPIAGGVAALTGTVPNETAAGEGSDETVRVYHLRNHAGSFIHGEHRLEPGGTAVVPKAVAELWVSHKGPNGLELVSTTPGEEGQRTSAENRLSAEKEAIANENAGLKAQIEGMQKTLAQLQAAAGGRKE